jgi:hypothetical protein
MASTESDLKRALGAFKKRLKMTRLDDESRLGRSPLSGSRRDKIVAIQPPAGFGRAIWEELADMGFLKRDTAGFYELTDKQWQNTTMAEHLSSSSSAAAPAAPAAPAEKPPGGTTPPPAPPAES